MSDYNGGVMAPAGWYPAGDQQHERYWNGAAWTDAYRPRSGVPSPVAPPTAYGPPPNHQPYGYQPYGYQPYGYVQAPNHGPAIASMVLGIVSFFISIFGVVTAIIGLTLGIMSLKECQPNGPKRGRGMAIAGISCSAVALCLWLIVGVMLGAFISAFD